jgi:hypothetical protein
VGLRGRLGRLEKSAERETITFRLKDGTTAHFHEAEIMPGCFLHESDRGRRHHFGEDPGPAHPFVEALRNAAEGEVARLVPTQGTVLWLWLGEDEIIRGVRKRPGPLVKETSPRVYE